jgi:hypothetical protein
MFVDPVNILHRAVVSQSHLQVSVVKVGVKQSESVEFVTDVGICFVQDSVYVDFGVFSGIVVSGFGEEYESLELLFWEILLCNGIVNYIQTA